MNETILQALRLAVENKYGHALTTRRDFDALVAMIEEDCHEHLSSTTIRRFWGYQKDQKSQISMTSLDILADYCGYRTFHNFEKEHSDVITNNEEQSGFITSPAIYLDTIKSGQVLRVKWNPGRCVTVRCNGGERFTVIESIKSKLRVGASFNCHFMTNGQPLFLTDMMLDGQSLGSYICGSKDGCTIQLE